MPKTLKIGTQKQLFIDNFIIDNTSKVELNLNQPRKYVGNPIMIPLYPWERKPELYGTVWHNEDGSFQMWYQGMGELGVPSINEPPNFYKLPDGTYRGFDLSNLRYTICYATSEDGIFWDRPNLKLVDYKGSKDNNIALDQASYANIIKDNRDSNPNRLYKALFYDGGIGASTMGQGVSVAFSPDGIKWTKYEGNPVIKRASDAHMLLGWDDLHNKYVAYARPSVHEGNKTRRVGRSTSDDFINWTLPETVLAPDELDPPGFEFYGMPVFKYEDIYLGQLNAYYAPPEEPQIRFYGNVEIQLASSRDGIKWERSGNRKAFIPNGPPGSIDAGQIHTARAPVIVENELWFYYSTTPSEHGIVGRSGPLCLAKLRMDGFVSADADDEMGTLITKPFVCEGNELIINASAEKGLVGVAILDESGIQYSGYSKRDCVLFDSDSISHKVTWQKRPTLDELKGKTIRLKFYLKNANLYSFTIR